MKKKIDFKTHLVFFLILSIIIIFFLGLRGNQSYDTKNILGKEISDFQLKEFNSDRLITKSNLNKDDYKLINFWASWCPPCKDEHTFLIKLAKLKNLKIYGINFKDNIKNAEKFLQDLGNPYSNLLLDKSGKSSINFGIYGIPESILLDKNLIVIKKYIGPINEKDYEEIKILVSK